MSYLKDLNAAQNCEEFYGTVENNPDSEPFTVIYDLQDSKGNLFESVFCNTRSKSIRQLALKHGDKVRFRASVVLCPTSECLQILDTDPQSIHEYESDELIDHYFRYVSRAKKIDEYPWEREVEEGMHDLVESLK